MGLFGGNKTETQNPTLNASTFESDKRKLLSANLILMEQNEIIIKYLDDICKKIDKMSSEE